MNELRVELKNTKSFQGREGLGLNADVYINGVKCFFVRDAGNGGCYDYDSYAMSEKNEVKRDRIKSLTQAVQDYAKEKYGDFEPLDHYIAVLMDELETAKLKAKEEKKMVKLMAQAIVFGVPDANNYRFYNFKKPLSSIPAIMLQSYVNQAKKVMKEGEVILNKNLAELGVKL